MLKLEKLEKKDLSKEGPFLAGSCSLFIPIPPGRFGGVMD